MTIYSTQLNEHLWTQVFKTNLNLNYVDVRTPKS